MGDTQLKSGAVLDGRFTLDKRLGSGSSGVVWRARDQQGGWVALKILHPKMSDDPAVARQFAREAKLLLDLSHPHIGRAFAYQAEGSLKYLALEYLPGIPLHELLGQHAKAHRPFSSDMLVQILRQVCGAMDYAHQRGIVHRDLKPQNVMVEMQGEVPNAKVVDFGVARLVEASAFDATTLGRQVGSLFYMSPEQIKGEPADARSDVFSLGTIFFELLTLHRAWARSLEGGFLPAFVAPVPSNEANSLAAVFTRIAVGERPRPTEVRRDLPTVLDDVVMRALALRPVDRTGSVVAFLADIEDALSGVTADRAAATALATPAERTEAGRPAADTREMMSLGDETHVLESAERKLGDPDAAMESKDTPAAELITHPPDTIDPTRDYVPSDDPLEFSATHADSFPQENHPPIDSDLAAAATYVATDEFELAPVPTAGELVDLIEAGPTVRSEVPQTKASPVPQVMPRQNMHEPRVIGVPQGSTAGAPSATPASNPRVAVAPPAGRSSSPLKPISAARMPSATQQHDKGGIPVRTALLGAIGLCGVIAGLVLVRVLVQPDPVELEVQAIQPIQPSLPESAPPPLKVPPIAEAPPPIAVSPEPEEIQLCHPELQELMERLQAAPSNRRLASSLRRKIREAAAELPAGQQRQDVEQIVRVSRRAGTIVPLSRALERLEEACSGL